MIKVSWYDQETRSAVVCSNDDAHSLVSALDGCRYVRQWCLDEPLESYPWYQEKLWNKLIHKQSEWDYSQ